MNNTLRFLSQYYTAVYGLEMDIFCFENWDLQLKSSYMTVKCNIFYGELVH